MNFHHLRNYFDQRNLKTRSEAHSVSADDAAGRATAFHFGAVSIVAEPAEIAEQVPAAAWRAFAAAETCCSSFRCLHLSATGSAVSVSAGECWHVAAPGSDALVAPFAFVSVRNERANLLVLTSSLVARSVAAAGEA